MSKHTGIDHSTLSWVKKELDETLKQSAEALELHTQEPGDTTQLQFCVTHLHQVHGILQMLELFGAALLVEEMEQVGEGLLENKISQKDDAYEVLMRAILQLSDYLERIQSGYKDMPILLLPLLNDLRAARGAKLLTENAVFAPNLDSAGAEPRRQRADDVALDQLAKTLRHRYQVGLLGYLRERNPKVNLGQMLEVLDRLDEAADDDQAGTVWWVGAGVVEALQLDGLSSSTAVKMLLGQVDRQIKRLIDNGETAFAVEPPRDLIRNLLYYVGRADAVGERVPAIQAQYELKDLVLDDAQIEQARDGMSGPNTEILETVSAAIKEDLATVKDALDLFVRGGQQDPERLGAVAESLGKIGDTLGVLGLGMPRAAVKQQLAVVEGLQGGAKADDQQLMEIARALLFVESSLDGLINRTASDQGNWLFAEGSDDLEDRERSERELFEFEYRQVFGSALGEAVAEVGRAKEQIVKFIESGAAVDLEGIDLRFESVRGALDLLGQHDASALLKGAQRYVAENIVPNRPLPGAEALDSLADAITSIEYYLESLCEGRSSAERILEVAESSLDRLGYRAQADAPEAPALQAADATEAAFGEIDLSDFSFDDAPEAEATVALPVAEIDFEPAAELGALEAEPVEFVAPEAPAVIAAAPAAVGRRNGRMNYDAPVLATELDDDILEIFLEEADEVLETIRAEYPKWRNNADDQAALVTCRRMFHTLKGSGRLAGALRLGELAWSIENLLNRVLDNTVQPDAVTHGIIDECVALLPAMIGQVRGGPEPTVDPFDLIYRAELLSDPARHAELKALQQAPAELTQLDEAGIDEPAVVESAVDEAIEIAELPEIEPAEAVELEALPVAELETELSIEAVALPDDEGLSFVENAVVAPVSEQDLSFDIEADAGFESSESVMPAAPSIDDATFDFELSDFDRQPEPEQESLQPSMDPVLYDIFSRETFDHLAMVQSFVDAGHAAGGEYPVEEALVRALHTLTGSARMADVEPIARLGRRFETYSEHKFSLGESLTGHDLDLLGRSVERIYSIVEALGQPDAELAPVDDLVDELEAAAAVLADAPPPVSLEAMLEQAEPFDFDETPDWEAVEVTAATAEPAERAEAIETLEAAEVPDAAESDRDAGYDFTEMDADLVELFLEEAQDILQFLETTVERWENAPDHQSTISELHRSLHTLKGGARLAGFGAIGNLCHVLEGISGDVADHKIPADDTFYNLLHACLDGLNDMVGQAKQGKTPTANEPLLQQVAELRGGANATRLPEPVESDGGDTELMEVFLEEAAEILAGMENTVSRWIDSPDQGEPLTELQRALHTLKGGARMAGFTPIGNLAHTLETLLTDVIGGSVPTTGDLFDLLEQVNDRLFSMRDQAEQGARLVDASDLLAAIEGLRLGKSPAAEAAPAPAPAAPAAPKAVRPIQEPEAVPASAEQAEKEEARGQQDVVRVRADLLDNLVNYAGEVSIYRARLEQQVGAIRFNLTELDQTVARLRDQLRTMDIETEAQILYRFEREYEGAEDEREDFDPLELDRFSRMQELSRALSESVNDLVSIQGLLDNLSRESETLLLQQSRVNTDMQDGLMRTRMVPFANLVPRMRRIVRQTCSELGKQAQFKVVGAQGEMDRTVLERVVPPLEHMLRNAVAHGVEAPEQRAKRGKASEGAITVALSREGADVVIRVSDDGNGLNLDAIRRKAVATGLMPEDAPLSDREVMQFILEAGFSTAESVNQIAGRGVGMDVVSAEIKQLGGTLEIDSVAGEGTTFTVRLPFTLAISQALLCQAGEDAYAIPLSSIEGVVRMTHEELEHCFSNAHQAFYDYAGGRYEVRSMAQLLGVGEANLPGPGKRSPIILVQTGDHRLALQVDGLLGNREIVVKSVGAQISTVPGIFGATILGDGRVVLILDVSALARLGIAGQLNSDGETAAPVVLDAAPEAVKSSKPTVMVVDDSITMRKVATRLLERNGMNVVTAKDGVDAVAQLQEVLPDAMLLDIEMPRMDGYELATHMRNDPRLKGVPIIMITSRTGEKHRQRAMEIGVNRYLGKPYQESDLLENLNQLLEEHRARS